jgi:cobalt-zinc-cadmium efflux system outer membrane protein
MRNFYNSFSVSLMLSTLLVFSATAQKARLPEALVGEALARNPELNYYRAEIAAAKGGLRTAGTIRNPEVSTHAGYKDNRDNGSSGEGGTFALSAEQTFEYPGRIALRTAIAKRDLGLAELRLAQFEASLAAHVRALTYGVLLAQEKVGPLREISGRFEALTSILKEREPAGTTALLEMQVIEANSFAFQRQRREAVTSVKTLLVQLNQVCGRSADDPVQIEEGRVAFTTNPSLTSILGRVRQHSFEIRIRETELAQQGFRVSLSKNERYPAVAVGPYYSYEKAADREQQVGIGISLPLPLWDRNAGNIQTAKAREEQARATLLATQQDVERRAAENATVFQSKTEEIALWQADTFQKFRESAALADRNYQLGSVPLALYIETQKQYLELVNSALEIKKEALQAAQELEVLTGLRLYKMEQAGDR